MPNIVGIDPSLTGTAVVVYSPTQATQPWSGVFTSKPADGLERRFCRYSDLARRVLSVITEAEPKAIAIEGYSFSSKGTAAQAMVEYGGLLRGLILAHRNGADVLEIPPATLKLFATGKGNAKKEKVISSLACRYGVEYDTSDEYDAYALCRLGACFAGLETPAVEWQRRALEKVKSGLI